ncbi:uncharacterized protein LOC111020782 [Momordica charantia]|uniref:Uncharacterized protein LOC111020782 n=1 Tax=Momordica charantia TaxID=3673 RepID=A0A6J1DID7_MOMCH|nr:uncharacterized protein LOC111020782 [Momordica charantia]
MYDWRQERTIFRYVLGRQSDYDTPWSEADIVYTPMNIGGNHWVMIGIDLVEGDLTVWDSLQAITPLEDLEKALKPMCTIIPVILHWSGMLALRPILHTVPWRVRRCTVPQQAGFTDCGIFCVRFFEYDVTGSKMDTLIQSNISLFRRQYAVQMWARRPFF